MWELCFSKSELIKLIENKSWLKNYSYLHEINVELQEIFKEQMGNTLTLENLEDLWGIKIQK